MLLSNNTFLLVRACFTKPAITHAHWQINNVIKVVATKLSNIEWKINSANIDNSLPTSEQNKEKKLSQRERPSKKFSVSKYFVL